MIGRLPADDPALCIKLPRLVAGYRRADQHLAPVVDRARGRVVEIDARELRSAAPGFTDRLVDSLLVEQGAKMLRVLHAPDRFVRDVTRSAKTAGYPGRVVFEP